MEADAALQRVLETGDEWRAWRALRLSGDAPGPMPEMPDQDELGAFAGESGRLSPGTTGLEICHLILLGGRDEPPAVVAADWLEEMRTPAGAWLDAPQEVPGDAEDGAAGRVWATASASCALLAMGRDPGAYALPLLRGESDTEGGFTGGAYPTFAGAAAFWMAEGPRSETAQWALRWTREWADDWWGPWEFVSALTFWGAAGIPTENASVDRMIDELQRAAPPEGWLDDVELTLRTLEVFAWFGA